MSYYPVFLNLSGKKAVVVGGGMVARRKIETLLEYGAIVHVISKDLTVDLQDRLNNGDIRLISSEFNERYIEDAFLVIVATNDKVLNRRVSEAAKMRNILVNAVDQPEECSFIVPSVIRRGDLLIAISTSGKSPAMARKIRETLADQFGKEYEYFLNIMGRVRTQLLSKDISEDERGRIFHDLVDSDLLELIRKQDIIGVASEMERILKRGFSNDDVIDYMKEE
jgi:precorrin-2 dehydrogenase / sirohydrochlorin ferrochelatase